MENQSSPTALKALVVARRAVGTPKISKIQFQFQKEDSK